MDQPKQDRMLRLMKMMSGGTDYSIEELSVRLNIPQRTIYRYIDTFKKSGYVVNKLQTNVYKIESAPQSLPDFDKLEKCGVEYAVVTVDGIGDIHDKSRILHNGKGTFAIIEKNLNEIDANMDIYVKMNIHKGNAFS